MPVYIDQTGRKVSISNLPDRIISIVPSQTELLFDLGLNEEVVGITKFCIHPQTWFHAKTKIGGTKQLKMDVIRQLSPNLIIANKEENVKEQIAELEKNYPVWVSDVKSLDDAIEMIIQLGSITGKQKESVSIKDLINKNFNELKAPVSKLSAAYLIWRNPFMTVGGDTFINTMMEICGFENVFKNQSRYPETTIEKLKNYKIDLLLLSSEPYPFSKKHIEELQSELPDCKIILVDGEMFSWYGSRLIKAPHYLQQLCQSL